MRGPKIQSRCGTPRTRPCVHARRGLRDGQGRASAKWSASVPWQGLLARSKSPPPHGRTAMSGHLLRTFFRLSHQNSSTLATTRNAPMMGPAMTPGLTPPPLAPSIGAQYCLGHSEHVLSVVSTLQREMSYLFGLTGSRADKSPSCCSCIRLPVGQVRMGHTGLRRTRLPASGTAPRASLPAAGGRCGTQPWREGGERIRGVEGMRVQESVRSDC